MKDLFHIKGVGSVISEPACQAPLHSFLFNQFQPNLTFEVLSYESFFERANSQFVAPTNLARLSRYFTSSHQIGDRLLNLYYQGLERNFPDKDERFPLSILKDRLERHFNKDILVMLVGKRVIAGCDWSLLATGESKTGIIDNIWVDPDYRNSPERLGEKLLKTVISILEKSGATAVVAEINDPHAMNEGQIKIDRSSGISPEARIRWWSRLGFKAIDTMYVQPALAPELEAVNYVVMGYKSLEAKKSPTDSETSITAELFMQIVEENIRIINPECEPSETEPYLEVLKGIGERTTLNLINLSNRRSYLD